MEPPVCAFAGAMVCVAMPAGVCTITATPPPANVMPALTLPDALVAVALALIVFGTALGLALVLAVVPAVVVTEFAEHRTQVGHQHAAPADIDGAQQGDAVHG